MISYECVPENFLEIGIDLIFELNKEKSSEKKKKTDLCEYSQCRIKYSVDDNGRMCLFFPSSLSAV